MLKKISPDNNHNQTSVAQSGDERSGAEVRRGRRAAGEDPAWRSRSGRSAGSSPAVLRSATNRSVVARFDTTCGAYIRESESEAK